jgi:hypothetical protein
LGVLVVAWLLACVGGLGLLWVYKTRPGDPGDPPTRWPAPQGLSLARDHHTMVMSVHPHCACTRATLVELERIVSRAPSGVRVYLLFVVPDGEPAGWEEGEHWNKVQRIAGAHVIVDHGGAIAERVFSLKVSGHVLIYDPGGELRFSGGITGARGHEGDNIGEQRVATILAGRVADAPESHVFGCSLGDPPGGPR